ncbi:MAG: hypothetical protein PHC41_05945 [Lachnospiraceae bacterium]|nr:hypothetical protein [Lachnospiraceae bacterium]MDD3615754.1 hypothetical protein [Lachnospiraceae bacterium]
MKHYQRSKSSLFLIELILCILIFSIASAICIQVFVKAHTRSRDSVNLNHAVEEAESIAELLRSDTALDLVYPEGQQTGESFVITYDDTWIPVDTQAVYTIEVTPYVPGTRTSCDIRVSSEDKLIYELPLTLY